MEGGEGGKFFGAGYGRLFGKWEKGGSVPFPFAFSVWDVLGKWFQLCKAIVY